MDLRNIDWGIMKFARTDEAIMFSIILTAVFLLALGLRYFRQTKHGHKQIILPAIIPAFRQSPWRYIRHAPLVLFIIGLPFFTIALADPYLSFVKEDVAYPGRRIAILVDASSSMDSNKFKTQTLNPKNDSGFFTAVAVAEHFVKLRINGKYQDLMALIEFGNESHIITPFTVDYQNILTSIKLISEPEERSRFPDQGTIIIRAINQSVDLFKTFGFLNAAGNIIVLISDGEDNQFLLDISNNVQIHLQSILAEARKNNIPIYFIRTLYDKAFGQNYGDHPWREAAEKTGGKFYAVSDESLIYKAVEDIDHQAVGQINVSRYSSRKPVFGPFLIVAVAFWSMGAISMASFKVFRKFP